MCVYSGGIWQPTCSGIARVSGAGFAWFANAAIEGIAQHLLLPSAVLGLNYLMRVIKNLDSWDWLNAGRGPRQIHIISSVADSIIYLIIIVIIIISIACIGCTFKCSVCREVAVDDDEEERDEEDEVGGSWSWTNCGNCKNHLQAATRKRANEQTIQNY